MMQVVGIRKGEAAETLAAALASSTDDCIIWPHSHNGDHPTMTVGGRRLYPHVVACVASSGPQPPGMEASHTCGRSLCVNPRHLTWETHGDNCRRRRGHGTQPRGETHGRAKLTAADVALIRTDPRSHAQVAAAYGMHPWTISLIRQGRLWR